MATKTPEMERINNAIDAIDVAVDCAYADTQINPNKYLGMIHNINIQVYQDFGKFDDWYEYNYSFKFGNDKGRRQIKKEIKDIIDTINNKKAEITSITHSTNYKINSDIKNEIFP